MSPDLRRTLRAAALAGLLAAVLIGGMAAFLGIPTATSSIAGLASGALAVLLVLGAARRSGHLDGSDEHGRPGRDTTEDHRG